jgi:hypothetical protein
MQQHDRNRVVAVGERIGLDHHLVPLHRFRREPPAVDLRLDAFDYDSSAAHARCVCGYGEADSMP